MYLVLLPTYPVSFPVCWDLGHLAPALVSLEMALLGIAGISAAVSVDKAPDQSLG